METYDIAEDVGDDHRADHGVGDIARGTLGLFGHVRRGVLRSEESFHKTHGSRSDAGKLPAEDVHICPRRPPSRVEKLPGNVMFGMSDHGRQQRDVEDQVHCDAKRPTGQPESMGSAPS